MALRALQDKSVWSILAAFAAVAVAFAASSAYTEVQLAVIDTDTHALVSTTFPEIQRLTALRSALRDLGGAMRDEVSAVEDHHTVSFERVERMRGRVESLLLQTPHPTEMATAVEAISQAIDRVRPSAERGDASGTRAAMESEMRPAMNQADLVARGRMDKSSAEAETIVSRIEDARRRSTRVAVVLDVLCVALAATAAFLVIRTVRRYSALLEEHGRFLERRADELEQFAGRVAHDVLSPLAATALAIGHAKRGASEPAALRVLERGESSLRRVQSIVDALLTFARSGARPDADEASSLRDVVLEVVEELTPQADKASVKVEVEGFPAAQVACARGVLSSVVTNLVQNAIKYIGSGTARVVTVRARTTAEAVHLEVCDTGPGLPPGMEETVFEPYVRAKSTAGQPGIGLGLATVKRLAVAHGGRVGVKPAPAGGACFWVELPRAPPAATAA